VPQEHLVGDHCVVDPEAIEHDLVVTTACLDGISHGFLAEAPQRNRHRLELKLSGIATTDHEDPVQHPEHRAHRALDAAKMFFPLLNGPALAIGI
jgi:hypothetical protein